MLDCHVHLFQHTDSSALASFLTRTGTERANLLACSHFRCLSTEPKAMVMKAAFPGRFYAFGAPDLSAFYFRADDLGEALSDHGQKLLEMGCDGIKLIEGKPQWRKFFPIPDFDLPVWEPFWAWAEENGVPLLWHVNDPENFWDREHAPSFAIAKGWVYDESYVNNEAQYAQVIRVLERHPRLKVCFAHFFFLSAQLDRLSALMDRFPGLRVDLTPGIEMYENFSARPEETARFFGKYHDRILYGTDIGGRCFDVDGTEHPFDEAENLRRPVIVRDFLTRGGEMTIASDGHYLIDRPTFVMRCLTLVGDRLAEITDRNFETFAGKSPRPVRPEAVLAYCAALREKLAEMGGRVPGFVPSDSAAAEGERFFAGA